MCSTPPSLRSTQGKACIFRPTTLRCGRLQVIPLMVNTFSSEYGDDATVCWRGLQIARNTLALTVYILKCSPSIPFLHVINLSNNHIPPCHERRVFLPRRPLYNHNQFVGSEAGLRQQRPVLARKAGRISRRERELNALVSGWGQDGDEKQRKGKVETWEIVGQLTFAFPRGGLDSYMKTKRNAPVVELREYAPRKWSRYTKDTACLTHAARLSVRPCHVKGRTFEGIGE